MSSDTISLQLEKREVVGKKIKQLRAQNLVPAVVYNRGESINVAVPYSEVNKAWQQAGKHHPIEVSIDGQKHLTLVKEVDFEPLKHEMRHIVFGTVRRDEKTEAEVPVVLSGDAPAERVGLIVLKQVDQVEVRAFPQDIPDEFTVNAERLAEMHDKVLVGDLLVPANVEILTDATIPVFIVEEPRAHAAAESEEESAESEESAEASTDDEPTSEKTEQE